MLPTRILDLTGLPEYDQSCAGDLDWHNKFRGKSLQLKQAQQDERGRYIALSYCWGTSLPCKTTTDNLDARLESIDFTSLPKTLQDSILITRVLGMDYIWIDCLCTLDPSAMVLEDALT